MLFSYPLLAGIQLACARIGSVTGHGIAQNLKRHYPRPVLALAVMLLLWPISSTLARIWGRWRPRSI
jgi:Mn2+/Fe2+ NRAMP family transporter